MDYSLLFVENDVTTNVMFQLRKFARGLYFRDGFPDVDNFFTSIQLKKEILKEMLVDYSNLPITPLHLRNVIGKGHREFSTSKQQDAQEYLLHFLNIIDRNISSTDNNPCDIFRFTIQDRIECLQTHHVQYSTRIESVLTLSIPRLTNCDEDKVSDFSCTLSVMPNWWSAVRIRQLGFQYEFIALGVFKIWTSKINLGHRCTVYTE